MNAKFYVNRLLRRFKNKIKHKFRYLSTKMFLGIFCYVLENNFVYLLIQNTNPYEKCISHI